ncbi:hypothetical protein [Actinomadura terrae]|uniref:hypothetical protein n=1 Tax=Actinomadura terrae TaxID=604353 RepID=UPI001FA7C62B|nr:hypothetical protein [Actinomadura terrae]
MAPEVASAALPHPREIELDYVGSVANAMRVRARTVPAPVKAVLLRIGGHCENSMCAGQLDDVK